MEESAATLTSELEDVKAKLADTSKELGDAKAEIRQMIRTAQAKDAGISEDKIEDTLAKFDVVDDEAFAAMLDLIKTQAHVSLEHTRKEDAEETEVVEEPVVEEAVEEEVIEEAVVEETEAMVDVPEPVQNGFASAAEFFRTSVLKTTKNLK